jgi:hypothetical protein
MTMANGNDWIDKLLRDDATAELADGGFSRRVMSALPPRAQRRLGWFKPLLVVGSAVLGSVLAVALGPSDLSLIQGFVDVAHSRLGTPSAMTGLAMSLAFLVCAIVLAAETD